MKAFSAWRGDSGAVAELQQVMIKKDLMILGLQTQLDAYRARFGELPADVLDQIEQEDAAVADAPKHSRELSGDRKELAAESSAAVAAASGGQQEQEKQGRKMSTPRAVTPTSARFRAASEADEAAAVKVQSRSSKNVVLDFVEDSPMFRRQLEGFEESITGLRALLKELVAHSKEYAAAGKHFGEEETALADELIQRKHARAIFSTSCPELGSLSELFGEMHDTLAQVQSSRVSMLLGVESLLNRSIQQFSEKEMLKEAGELRKEVSRLGDEYETLLGKLLSKSRQPGQSSNGMGTPTGTGESLGAMGLGSPALPMGSYTGAGEFTITGTPPASAGSSNTVLSSEASAAASGNDKQQRALERDVVVARRRFELARFDLVRFMNRIDCTKKFVLVECFNSILYAQLGHFHACHELVKSVEPTLRRRQEMMQVSRKDFDQDELMWASQREQLDKRLSQDVEFVSSAYSSSESPAAGSALSIETAISYEAFPSLDLPVEVISTDTWSSRQTVAASPGGVAKQGYLFVRNAMFPARSWKRRWFQIHAGKLFQTTSRSGTGKHPAESSLTLVCDLLLARVRELEGSSLPFCFEVIDASRAKLLLQAASARDMAEWIEAARRSTENALEKQSHRQEVHPEQQSVIDELTEANPCCADCGQDPAEWVSINIGCLLCIECSGIHRSLGVHESKVRSLALDSWDMSLLTLLRDELGNEVVNGVWEHTVPEGWSKPTPATPREEKSRYIKAKYHFHGFAEPDATLSALEDDDSVLKHELAKRFLTGASHGNLKELMWCLAHGVDVNVRAGDQHETALHVSAASGAAACCEYLVLNGASLTLTDKRGRLPYDAAKAGGFENIKLTLMQKMSLEQYQS